MDLETVGTIDASAAKTLLQGADSFSVAAGQSLKIETSPGGAEVLDAECPAGKAWTVSVRVTVTETDA